MIDNGQQSAAEKALDIKALGRSVVKDQQQITPQPPTVGTISSSIIWQVATAADEITQFGYNPKRRDQQLRIFYPKEYYFSSALGIVCARNAAFSWAVSGAPRTSSRVQEMLLGANKGKGWEDFIIKMSTDLYTQDHGSFAEIIREGDSEKSPVIGVNHLDAARCWHTGDPERPVIYLDRLGIYHLMKWYQVLVLAEMPIPVEGRYGLQLCALSRVLGAVQIMRNMTIYKEEKTGGRFNRAVHLVKGVKAQQIEDALALQRASADAKGLLRYVNPLIVDTVSPEADIGHDTIELASLPDGFNEKDTASLYIGVLAMGFLSDYQEFAPLPGGNLGTSSQSEILHLKSKGKGPGLFMKLLTHKLNFEVLPNNVEFAFDEQDIEADKALAEVRKLRAEKRQIQVAIGELTPEAARQEAYDDGDITEEIFQALGGVDLTPDKTIDDEAPAKEGEQQPAVVLPKPEEEEEEEQKEFPDPFWEKVWQDYP